MILLVRIFHPADAISQTFDAVYHLNLVEWFISTGNASSAAVNILSPDPVFYPAAWHVVVSAIAMTFGVNAAVATNVFTMVAVAVMWPAGIYIGAWFLSRGNSLITAIAVVASLLFAYFPYYLLYYGVLYPTLLSYTYVGAMLGLLFEFTRATSVSGRVTVLVVGSSLIPGVVLSQTSTAFYIALISMPFIFVYIYELLQRHLPRIRRVGAAILAAALSLGFLLLINYLSLKNPVILGLRTKPTDWGPTHPGHRLRALWEVSTGSFGLDWWNPTWRHTLPLQLVILAGLVYLFRKRLIGLLGACLTSYLFLFGILISGGQHRSYIYGMWYGDVHRIAAANVVLNVLVFAFGVMQIALWAIRFTKVPESREDCGFLKRLQLFQNPQQRLTTIIIVALLFPALLSPNVVDSVNRVQSMFHYSNDEGGNGLVNAEEYKLLHRVPSEVPSGYKVIGNPWNGSALVQAIAGRETLYPHVQYTSYPDYLYISENLRTAKRDPKVCQLVRKFHVGYVLDFGNQYLWGGVMKGRLPKYDGLKDLDYTGIVTLVDREGPKKLFKITACGDIQPESSTTAPAN